MDPQIGNGSVARSGPGAGGGEGDGGQEAGETGGGKADAAWDVFRVTPSDDKDETVSSKWMEFLLKVMKAAAYVITFAIVLSTSVFSKSIILLMTSMIKVNRTISVCNAGLDRDKRYLAKLEVDDPERIVWVWSLLVVMLFPEVLALFRAARICTFKMYKRPEKGIFIAMYVMETLHTVGLCILVFAVLPELDVVRGAMLTNCLCFVPGLLGLLSRNSTEGKRGMKVFLDLLAVGAQLTSFIIWPLTASEELSRSGVGWMIPLSSFLVSCGWWENYVDENSPVGFVRGLGKMRKKLHRSRYFAWIFISIWKIILICCMMVTCRYFMDGSVRTLFSQFKSAFAEHKITLYVDRTPTISVPSEYAHLANDNLLGIEEGTDVIWSSVSAPIWLIIIQISASWICYVFGKFACKIYIQGFSYAFPLSLTVPVTISVLIAACGLHLDRKCQMAQYLPRYLFFNCQEDPFETNSALFSAPALMWLIWLLSQTWIAIHIWTPQCERLATTEKLFVNPMYSGVIIDQSMSFNRRRDDKEKIKSEELNLEAEGVNPTDTSQHYETISEHLDDAKKGSNSTVQSSDHVTRILACATMWHETSEEMIQMLKSIFRMDDDQSARRNAQKYLRIVDPDYYEFEVHIFFDDAFELSDVNDDWMQVNRFVKLLVEVIDQAAMAVHECHIRVKPPKKYPTPYGGRLEWTLPGGTKLNTHLKDKTKIRHRKRWSQVMYMYYLLGHRLMELPIDVNRKAVMAENTYLLTLDGDINFRPQAVQLLVDLMKKNRNLGAACGRIHPIGSGPMVWYQKFEYAIGHWLQKATEHMIGCVLCAPGCFSLFRAKALMDDNVMRRYTQKSEEALHYVQYDQGEDRWLCTLLLQRGYRVEYSAASDAYTHCPEGFGEFYTQRRRWAPSTMANIMDLLGDYRKTIAINDSISLPYVIYQAMLMVGTILGPGTIFLMLVGAMVAALRISNYYSFYYNIIPILAFIVICFTCKNDIQILVAQMLSSAYALLMTAVFVGIGIQMTEDSVVSPTAIFFIALMSSFFIAASLHPQEFGCIFPFPLYMLSIPCMYLLLTIYSLINLNVVTWGTREVQTKKTKKEIEQERKEEEDLKKKSILGFLRDKNANEEEGSITFSLAGLFKCLFCTHPKPSEEKIHLIKIEDHLGRLTKKMSSIEKSIDHVIPPGIRRKHSSTGGGRRGTFSDNLSTVTENDGGAAGDAADLDHHHHHRHHHRDDFDSDSTTGSDMNSSTSVQHEKRDDNHNPYWIEDKELQDGEVAYLHPQEIQFWKELIDKYLKPIDANKEHEARVAVELKELRNRVVFFFFMLNSLYILVVFLLQLNKNILFVEWPWGARRNVTFDPERNEAIVDEEPLHLEPIGLVFVVFFGLILIIQFVGMSFHRFATMSHILASVELSCCSTKVEDINDEDFIDKNAIQIARQLQRLKDLNETEQISDSSHYGHNRVDRRKTIQILDKRQQQQNKVGTLDVAFRKRFMAISAQNIEGTPVLGGKRSRETVFALEKRRNAAIGEDGRMQTLGQKNEFVRGQAKRSTLDNGPTGRRRPIPFSTQATGSMSRDSRESEIERTMSGGPVGGLQNKGYIRASSDEDDDLTLAGQERKPNHAAQRDASPSKRMSSMDRNAHRSDATGSNAMSMNIFSGNASAAYGARQSSSTSSTSAYGHNAAHVTRPPRSHQQHSSNM